MKHTLHCTVNALFIPMFRHCNIVYLMDFNALLCGLLMFRMDVTGPRAAKADKFCPESPGHFVRRRTSASQRWVDQIVTKGRHNIPWFLYVYARPSRF